MILFMICVAFTSFYFNLGSYGLLNDNEGLYAEIPREMLISGDFILPHLNGVPYIEKPPLLYWLIAFSYHLFGVNESAARFIPATSGFLTFFILTWFLWRLGRETSSIIAGLIWSTSLGVIVLSRTVMFDMLLTCLLTLTLTSYYMWVVKRTRIYLSTAYIALALAILTKGMVALVLTIMVIIVFTFIKNQHRSLSFAQGVGKTLKDLTDLLSPLEITIFLTITVPWHVIMAVRAKHFLWFYFINEDLLRFLGLREPHDYYSGPFYYYLIRVFAFLFPWCFMLPVLLLRSSRSYVTGYLQRPGKRTLQVFLWTWFLTFLAFFTISRAKANYYMITGTPPLIILMALKLKDYHLDLRKILFPFLVTAGLGLSMIFAWVASSRQIPRLWVYTQAITPAMLYTLGISCIGGIILCWVSRRRWPLGASCLAFTAFSLIFLCIALDVAHNREDNFSEKNLVKAILAQNKGAHIYLYHDFEKLSSTVFYARKPLCIVDSHSSDLAYAQKLSGRRHKVFVTHKEFCTISLKIPCYAIMRTNEQQDFKKEACAPRFYPWKCYGGAVVYCNIINTNTPRHIPPQR